MKSIPILGNQSSILLMLFFSSVGTLKINQMVFVLFSGTIQFQAECDWKLTGWSAPISPYLAKFIKHKRIEHSALA